MDVVNHVKQHPQPGETIHGMGTAYSPGGKGANQAVAAALAGGAVVMLGAVGNDGFAQSLLPALAGCGVDTQHVLHKDTASGLAFITVAESGENTIILSAGANDALTAQDVTAAAKDLAEPDVLLLQNEIPWSSTVGALQHFHSLQTRVYLNPAPARDVAQDLLKLIDVLILNETEAQALTGVPVKSLKDAQQAATQLQANGANVVVITLGANGSVCVCTDGTSIHTPAFAVQVVDTTAAGDTFIGALAVASGKDLPTADALRFASAASAITVTRKGAQGSIPTRVEIERFLQERATDA